MINELIFLIQIFSVGASALVALLFGAPALVAFVCVCGVLANLFVLKQITLFSLNATAADAFAVGATLGLNLLQEYFGRTITKKTIWINFYLLVFYALASQIHLTFTPSVFDAMHNHFEPLLTFMPRITVASFITFLVAQSLDYALYGLLRRLWKQRFLVIRNYISIIISQFVDTVLFAFLGLYGIVDNIGHIIIISYGIKLAVIFLATPFVGFSRIILRSK